MKKVLSAGVIIAASVLTCSSVFGQQTSSAVQVVTFGVARPASMLVSSLNSSSLGTPVLQRSSAKTLQHNLANIRAKITFSSKTSRAGVSYENKSLRGEMLAPVTGLHTGSRESGIDGRVQEDLRTFLQEKDTSPLGESPLVLTITE